MSPLIPLHVNDMLCRPRPEQEIPFIANFFPYSSRHSCPTNVPLLLGCVQCAKEGKMTGLISKDPFGTKNGISAAVPEIIWILYGTHTGNSERLANETSQRLSALGLQTKVYDMESFPYGELTGVSKLLIIVSTDGDGEPPIMAEDLLAYLRSDKAVVLSHLDYSVLALGDTCYYHFCQAGKDFDTALHNLGGRRLIDRVDCDTDYEDDYQRWLEMIGKTIQRPKY